MKKTKQKIARIELNADEKEILTKASKILEEISDFITENADMVVASQDVEEVIDEIYNFSGDCCFIDDAD